MKPIEEKTMSRILIIVTATFVFGSVTPHPVLALPDFKKAFQKKYVDKDNEAYTQVFRKSACNTCHVKGEKKSVHNDYGKHLSKLIQGNAKQRLKDAKSSGNADEVKAEVLRELDAAFEKVAKMKTSKESDETFGDRIKAGKLPVEPPKKEESEKEK